MIRPDNPWRTADNPDGIIPISALFRKKPVEQPVQVVANEKVGVEQKLNINTNAASLTSKNDHLPRPPLEKPGDLGKGFSKAKMRYAFKWLVYYMPDIIKVAVLVVVLFFLAKIILNMAW